MIAWEDGLETSPDGVVREVPTRNHVWASTVWITKRGVARRRYFNLANKTWSWDENPLPVAIDDESGKVGFFIEWFISVERAIASAWLRRGQNSNWTIHRRPGTEDKPPKASNLAWTQMEMEEEENEPLPGEIFKPMRGSYKFSIGAVPVNPMYEVSNKGRLRSPFTGKITRGWVFNHTRIASVKGAGLLDLLIASRVKPNVKYLAPAVKLAVDCLGAGCSPQDLARYQGVALSTAWTKFCVAQQFIDLDVLMKYVPQLVSRDLWVVLRNMQQSGDARLGGRLLDLHPLVEDSLSPDGEYLSGDFDKQMRELRLARAVVVRSCGAKGDGNYPIDV